MNEEDLKCQQKDELEYVTLFSDTVEVSPWNKTKSSEWNDDEWIVKMTMNENK